MTRDEEDQVLGRLLRRFLTLNDDEDVYDAPYVGTNGRADNAALTLDGHIDLTPTEGAIVFRILGHDTSGVRS